MKSENNEDIILKTYKEKLYIYEELDEIIYNKLLKIIKENNFFVMDISHRVKTTNSLKGKLRKKVGKYSSIYDITDLCAARIICYFSDTIDDIASVIRKEFIVDEKNSVDKRAVMEATQFGYLSLHYILSLKKEEGFDEELTNIKFEIQMRTVLQHAWAEIEHDLGYKSEFGVPVPVRREFSRVASLLEIADNQFVDLRTELNNYKINIRKQIASGQCENLLLDQITVNEYVSNNIEFNEFVEKMVKELNVEYIASTVDNYLPELNWLGIKTIGDMYRMLTENRELTIAMIQNKLVEFDLDMVTTAMVIRYMCRSELVKSGYTKSRMLDFIMIGTDNKEVAQKRLDKMMMVMDSRCGTGDRHLSQFQGT